MAENAVGWLGVAAYFDANLKENVPYNSFFIRCLQQK